MTASAYGEACTFSQKRNAPNMWSASILFTSKQFFFLPDSPFLIINMWIIHSMVSFPTLTWSLCHKMLWSFYLLLLMYYCLDMQVNFNISLRKYLRREKSTAKWIQYSKAKVKKTIKDYLVSCFQLYQPLLISTNADEGITKPRDGDRNYPWMLLTRHHCEIIVI